MMGRILFDRGASIVQIKRRNLLLIVTVIVLFSGCLKTQSPVKSAKNNSDLAQVTASTPIGILPAEKIKLVDEVRKYSPFGQIMNARCTHNYLMHCQFTVISHTVTAFYLVLGKI